MLAIVPFACVVSVILSSGMILDVSIMYGSVHNVKRFCYVKRFWLCHASCHCLPACRYPGNPLPLIARHNIIRGWCDLVLFLLCGQSVSDVQFRLLVTPKGNASW